MRQTDRAVLMNLTMEYINEWAALRAFAMWYGWTYCTTREWEIANRAMDSDNHEMAMKRIERVGLNTLEMMRVQQAIKLLSTGHSLYIELGVDGIGQGIVMMRMPYDRHDEAVSAWLGEEMDGDLAGIRDIVNALERRCAVSTGDHHNRLAEYAGVLVRMRDFVDISLAIEAKVRRVMVRETNKVGGIIEGMVDTMRSSEHKELTDTLVSSIVRAQKRADLLVELTVNLSLN